MLLQDGWARKEDFQSLELRQLRSYSKEVPAMIHNGSQWFTGKWNVNGYTVMPLTIIVIIDMFTHVE
jgi:hypothetical protein